MYVCLCHGVTDSTIKKAAREGVRSVEQLGDCTQLGTCCGCCRDVAEIILNQAVGAELPSTACVA